MVGLDLSISDNSMMCQSGENLVFSHEGFPLTRQGNDAFRFSYRKFVSEYSQSKPNGRLPDSKTSGNLTTFDGVYKK